MITVLAATLAIAIFTIALVFALSHELNKITEIDIEADSFV